MSKLDTTATKRQRQGGFTLVEMIVSVGIFTIVATAAAGALVSVVESNRRTRTLADTTNNLNFVLQNMVRGIRIGFNYGCNSDSPSGTGDQEDTNECPSGKNEFGFVNSDKKRVGYRLDSSGDRIVKDVDNQGGSDDTKKIITPEDITITDLTFRVVGSNTSDQQARVLITIEAKTGDSDTDDDFSLQTTATQRLLYTPN